MRYSVWKAGPYGRALVIATLPANQFLAAMQPSSCAEVVYVYKRIVMMWYAYVVLFIHSKNRITVSNASHKWRGGHQIDAVGIRFGVCDISE